MLIRAVGGEYEKESCGFDSSLTMGPVDVRVFTKFTLVTLFL